MRAEAKAIMLRVEDDYHWLANGFEALSISEELAQSVALGDVQHLCMFHLTQ